MSRLAPDEVDDLPVGCFERMLRRPPAGLPPGVERAYFALLVGVGLRRGRHGRRLVLGCFQRVHGWLAKSEIESARWSICEKLLPDLGLWKSWDKCEGLRRGLLERALAHDWPASELLEALSDRETFAAFVTTCRSTEAGRRLLHKLERAAKTRPACASQHQRRALAS